MPPQMVSLLHLADIDEEGVTFQSPTDGRRMLLTPEHSIQARGRNGIWRVCTCTLQQRGRQQQKQQQQDAVASLPATPWPRPPPDLSTSQVQNRLGADIIMALDDVVPSTAADAARFEEATHRTTRWIDRCIAAHGRPSEQNLFAIVQGGLDERLREVSLKGLVERDTPGYAIGGLAGGEDKTSFIQ